MTKKTITDIYIIDGFRGIRYSITLERIPSRAISSASRYKAVIMPHTANGLDTAITMTFTGHCYEYYEEAQYIIKTFEDENEDILQGIYRGYAMRLYAYIGRDVHLMSDDIDSDHLTRNYGCDGYLYYWLMDNEGNNDVAIRLADGEIMDKEETKYLFS